MRSGNLSVLKKRWERTPQEKSGLQLSVAPSVPRKPSILPEPPASSSKPVRLASLTQEPTPHERPAKTKADMETKQKKRVEEKEENESASDPFSPSSPLEKPVLPLNNLKMMFEKGKSKVRMSQMKYITAPTYVFSIFPGMLWNNPTYCNE